MSDSVSILFFSTDRNYAELLAENLLREQMRVQVVADAELALDNFARNYYDLCIIDCSAARSQGLSVVSQMRQMNTMMPLLVLSTRQDKQDIIEGYDAGCDEYIVIPIATDVLVRKLRSWLRRLQLRQPDKVYRFASCVFDSSLQTLAVGDQPAVVLSVKQSEVLRILADSIGQLVERKTILRQVWKDDSVFASRSLNVFISSLRNILSADDRVELRGLRGRGYRLIIR